MDRSIDVHEAELDGRLSALEAARTWNPRVVSRLESRVRTAEDLALFRVNPKAYATETSMDPAEAIDLFLHAAAVGLFQMEWNLVCASCGNTARSFRGLAKMDPHFICDLCQMVNDPSLDEYVQVAFTVSPGVRAISYHEPESLSAENRIFNYQVSHDIRPGSGPLTSLLALRSSTHLVEYLDPGDSASVQFDFDGEALAVRDLLHAASAMYILHPDDSEDAVHIRLVLEDEHFRDLDRTLAPLEFKLTERVEMRLLFPAQSTINRHGPTIVSVANDLLERALVWVVAYPKIPRIQRAHRVRAGPLGQTGAKHADIPNAIPVRDHRSQ